MNTSLSPGVVLTENGYAVSGREALERACASLVAARDPHLPLWRAAADGLIALITLEGPTAKWSSRDVANIRRPVVVLVADDPAPAGAAVGAGAWDCARRLKYWCRAAIIHGTGPDPDHYRAAVGVALAFSRLVLVETDSQHALAWRDFLGCPRSMLLVPPPGCAHPQMPSQEARQ